MHHRHDRTAAMILPPILSPPPGPLVFWLNRGGLMIRRSILHAAASVFPGHYLFIDLLTEGMMKTLPLFYCRPWREADGRKLGIFQPESLRGTNRPRYQRIVDVLEDHIALTHLSAGAPMHREIRPHGFEEIMAL